jgi:methenyltetrahydromethanopterin cyclohydrolase
MKKILIYGALPTLVIALVVISVVIWLGRDAPEQVAEGISGGMSLEDLLFDFETTMSTEGDLEPIPLFSILEDDEENEMALGDISDSTLYTGEEYEYIEGYVPSDDEHCCDDVNEGDHGHEEEWVEPEAVG